MTGRSRTLIASLYRFCLIFTLAGTPLFAQITFSDFSDVTNLTRNGSAVKNGQLLSLTQDGSDHVSGSAWFNTEQPVAAGFTSVFKFQITHSPSVGAGPADGIAFVIQNSGTAARGGAGGAIGYGEPDAGDDAANGGHAIVKSLAVEFDTYQNGWDPDANHIAVQSCGSNANSQKHPTCQLGIFSLDPSDVRLADGNVHTAIIEYDPGSNPSGTGVLRVYVDNTAVPKLSVPLNLSTLLPLDGTNQTTAFVGFTGSTGGSTENNDILSWTFTPAAAQTTVAQPLATGNGASTDSVFGSYDHKILNYFTINSNQLTVTAIPETQAQFTTELNGQFNNAQCLVYDGTGGLCVKFRVVCTGGDCSNLDYEITENFNNNNQGNPVIVGAGMLKRQIPANSGDFPTWANIIETFSQSRLADPGGKAKSTGFSEFILCQNCTAKPTISSSPSAPYVLSPATVTFACATDPAAPFVKLVADTGCTSKLNGNTVLSGDSVALNAVGSNNTLEVLANDTVGDSSSSTTSFITGQAPIITSGNSATFQVGVAGSFPVTVTGVPAPTVTVAGTLPSGVTFNGTAFVGTPAAATGGAYSLIAVSATNGLSPDASQAFTLTVNQPPAITSGNSATFQASGTNAFTVTTTGFPTASLSATSVAGLSFTDNHNGTGTLSGIPNGTGPFAITFTAQNGVNPVATQNFTLNVSGPQISISPSNIDFGSVPYLNLLNKNITVKNIGSTNIQMGNVTINRIQADLDDFLWLNLCPNTLAPGKSCTITVIFLADDLGTRSAVLKIADNVPGSPQLVSLTANVINPKASFSPSSLNFGTLKVGSSSAKVITLSNPGNAPLAINQIAITAPNTADFKLTHNCPSSLAVSASCAITVTFKPTAKGNRAAGLTITDNMFPGLQVVPLTGNGN